MSKCTKKSFVYYNIAKMALRKIGAHPSSTKGGRIPCDIYLCPDCGAYHLTSMTREEYKHHQHSKMKVMTIEIPVSIPDKQKVEQFENYLKKNLFPFKRKGKGVFYYAVTIEEPINAFWIGCNLLAIQYGLLKN